MNLNLPNQVLKRTAPTWKEVQRRPKERKDVFQAHILIFRCEFTVGYHGVYSSNHTWFNEKVVVLFACYLGRISLNQDDWYIISSCRNLVDNKWVWTTTLQNVIEHPQSCYDNSGSLGHAPHHFWPYYRKLYKCTDWNRPNLTYWFHVFFCDWKLCQAHGVNFSIDLPRNNHFCEDCERWSAKKWWWLCWIDTIKECWAYKEYSS